MDSILPTLSKPMYNVNVEYVWPKLQKRSKHTRYIDNNV